MDTIGRTPEDGRERPDSDDVEELQRALRRGGFWPRRIDGELGDDLGIAVANFREEAGIGEEGWTGVADPATFALLTQFVAQLQEDVAEDVEKEIDELELANISTKKAVIERLEAQLKLMLKLEDQLEYSERLYEWRLRLIAELKDRAAKIAAGIAPTPAEQGPVDGSANVDVTASDLDRAKTLFAAICQVVDDLDAPRQASTRAIAKKFLMALAWHESRKCKTRVQDGDGPARSFYQIEAHRARECVEYAKRKGWLDRLAKACGKTEKELEEAAGALPDFDAGNPNASARFPEGNLIEECLRTNDLFGTYLTRICFRKVAAAIPDGANAQAEYWYTYWKGSGGDRDELIRRWTRACLEISKLLGLE